MSFAEQERVLFELLFDPELREQFSRDMESVLKHYQLDKKEKDDFKTIRPDALALDASMRAGLLLSSISHSYPITFSIVSSLGQGMSLLKALVDTETMKAAPTQRASVFGARLREFLSTYKLELEAERPVIVAILEAELGMAWTAATLKQHTLEHGRPEESDNALPVTWDKLPVKLAEFVSVAMLPASYETLKQQLCPKTECDLYTQLCRKPLAPARRTRVLQQQDPRLHVARALVIYESRCEPAIDHLTLELSEGFAHLFQHINGSNSIEELLAAFKQAGAPDALLSSVSMGFKQLLEMGMLVTN